MQSGRNRSSGETRIVKRVRRGKAASRYRADKISLERILGLTVTNSASLACSPSTGVIAYPAGCVVVLYNPRKNKQSHITSSARKPISCLAFSKDGGHLATGESGHQPLVRVWQLGNTPSQVAELSGHRYGISMVAFTPCGKYLISVGYEHDMGVFMWKWKTGQQVATNKVSTKVTGLSFSDGGYFVTAGNRHIRYWYIEAGKGEISTARILQGRSAVLGSHRNLCFLDVACGRGKAANSTFAVTKNGWLVQFSKERQLEKYVTLTSDGASCITASEKHVFCGCHKGTVRVFDSQTLAYVATLPQSHALGVDVASIIDASAVQTTIDGLHKQSFPDVVALSVDHANHRLTCIYSDRSLYVWDIRNIHKVGKLRSFLHHSSCVWDIQVYSPSSDLYLPRGTFATGSSDDTIRLWNLGNGESGSVFRNIYSKELMRIIYSSRKHEAANLLDGGTEAVGFRAIQFSPDSHHLACGDRAGNLHVYELQFFDEVVTVEAHDGEILSVEYSKPSSGYHLLATASRDRLIHIFDTERYDLLQTLDDHSASVTSVKFAFCQAHLQLVSCAADKSIMFRTAQENSDVLFQRTHHVAGKVTSYDMAVTSQSDTHVLATACQDRQLRLYNLTTGKPTRSFKASASDEGALIKVEIDSSGRYIATCGSDRCLSVFDFVSGESVAALHGHSELITGVKFTADMQHLISVSADGCIFVWRLTDIMRQTMAEHRRRSGRQSVSNEIRRGTYTTVPSMTANVGAGESRLADTASGENNRLSSSDLRSHIPPAFEEEHGSDDSTIYRFSMGRLPPWAQNKLQDSGQATGDSSKSRQTREAATQPRTKWAERVDPSGLMVASELDEHGVCKVEHLSGSRPRYSASDDSHVEEVATLASSSREDVLSRSSSREDVLSACSSREDLKGTGDGREKRVSTPFSTDDEEDEDTDDEESTIYLPSVSEDSLPDVTFRVTESCHQSPVKDAFEEAAESDEVVEASSDNEDDVQGQIKEDTLPPPESKEDSAAVEELLFKPVTSASADKLFGTSNTAHPTALLKCGIQANRLSISSRFLARSRQCSSRTSALSESSDSASKRRDDSPSSTRKAKMSANSVCIKEVKEEAEASNATAQAFSRPGTLPIGREKTEARKPSPVGSLSKDESSVSLRSRGGSFNKISPAHLKADRSSSLPQSMRSVSPSALKQRNNVGSTADSSIMTASSSEKEPVQRISSGPSKSFRRMLSDGSSPVTSPPLGSVSPSECDRVIQNLKESCHASLKLYQKVALLANDNTTGPYPRMLEKFTSAFSTIETDIALVRGGAAQQKQKEQKLSETEVFSHPATAALLEKYSETLCSMVCAKLLPYKSEDGGADLDATLQLDEGREQTLM